MRRALMVVMVLALSVMHWGLDLRFPVAPVVACLIAWAGLELVWLRQIRAGQAPGAESRELLAHLTADAVALAALLYFTGGYTNPLISLLLAPLALGATVLRSGCVWSLAGIIAALYSFLVLVNEPLGIPAHRSGEVVWLHLLGMWLAFIVTALLLAGLVARLSAALREREHELARLREAAMRREQVLGLGLLAAGAAHELGTPLATMAVVAEELGEVTRDQPGVYADVAIIQGQIARCKTVLAHLRQYAGGDAPDAARAQQLGALLEDFVTQWRLLRPQAPVSLHLPDRLDRPAWLEPTVRQALANLLDNAADAARTRMDIEFQADDDGLRMHIADDGPGPGSDTARLGRAPVTSAKPDGMGIGLMLSSASLERVGGSASLSARAEGGTLTSVYLPWSALQPRTANDRPGSNPAAGR